MRAGLMSAPGAGALSLALRRPLPEGQRPAPPRARNDATAARAAPARACTS